MAKSLTTFLRSPYHAAEKITETTQLFSHTLTNTFAYGEME